MQFQIGMKIRALRDIDYEYDLKDGGVLVVHVKTGDILTVYDIIGDQIFLEIYPSNTTARLEIYIWGSEWDNWHGLLELLPPSLKDQRMEVVLREW